MAVLALVAGLSGLAATPAAAVDDTDHATLPTTGYAADVVAASGTGIIMEKAGDEGAYQVSVDSGQTFTDLSAPAFTGQVSYVGAGKVLYFDPTGDTDATGDFFNLYTYDLASGTTPEPVKLYAAEVKAVTPGDAVVANEAPDSGYSAVDLPGGSRTPLIVPDHDGTPAFTLGSGATALAATVARDGSGVLGAGFLDSVPLSGASGTSLPVPGLATARLSGTRAYWVRGDTSGAALCWAPATTLASPTCRTLATGDYSHGRASLEAGPGWVVARLRSDSGKAAVEYVLSGPDTLATVAPASGMLSLAVYGRGDTTAPLATVLADDGGYIGTYAAGSVTRLFDLPQVPATTGALFVTPRTISGLDDRPAAGVAGQQAWTRPLNGVNLGAEQLLSPRATDLAVSGDRTLVSTASGAQLLDAGQPVRSLAGVTHGRALSGPYFLSGPTSNPVVMRVDGVAVPPVGSPAGPIIALFGSLALRAAGAGYDVVDVNHPATVVAVDLGACAGSNFAATAIWGDWILAEDTDSGDTVVLNYRHPANCYAHAGAPLALGDGFALVAPIDPDSGNPDLVAWDFLHGATDDVANNPSMVATDGSSIVAWTTATKLWTASIDGLINPSAPRVLGVLAASTVAGGTPWKLDLDATRGLKAGGHLDISNAAHELVSSIAIDTEAPNGSLRDVTWDGMINGDPAPVGDYTWTLANLRAGNNNAVLVNTDGSAVTGPLAVTATTLLPVVGATPTLSVTKPVVGTTIKVTPGAAWAPQPVTFAYQWYRDSVLLYGETHQTYQAVADDLGHRLTVSVTGSAAGRTRVTKTSAPSAAVGAGALTPTAVTLNHTSPVVEQTVTTLALPWGPGVVDLSYQWYRVSSKGKVRAITKETHADYLVRPADVGYRLKVKVTGTSTGFAARSVYTKVSAKVKKATFATGPAPTITGVGQVGQVLTAVPGVYSPQATFAYKWYRGKAAIKKATRVTYTLQAADRGKVIKLQVTATRPGYTTVVKTVKLAAVVLAQP